MNLILRGHVRGSLKNDDLYRLVKCILIRMPETRIYIHSWNVVQTSLSWRSMPADSSVVDDKQIVDYLRDAADNIRKIVIEDDSNVAVPGRVSGTVASTPCPIKGYKLMFYGMMRGAEMVAEDRGGDEHVMQTRFDILSNFAKMDHERIMRFLDRRPSEDEPVRFLIRPGDNKTERELRFDRWRRHGSEYEPHWTLGVENIFSANVTNMKRFLSHMYSNFDSINDKYMKSNHQEWLPMFEAFNPEWAAS